MTSWPSNESLRAIDIALVGPLQPVEVLYEFDGPCIFTARTAAQTLVLAYLAEEIEEESLLRFIVSAVSDATVSAMKEGVVSVREAIERGSLWLVDVNHRYEPERAFAVRIDELPDDVLPQPNTMLWSELDP